MKKIPKLLFTLIGVFIFAPTALASIDDTIIGRIFAMGNWVSSDGQDLSGMLINNHALITLGRIFGSGPSDYFSSNDYPLTAIIFQYFNVGVMSIVGSMAAYTSVQAVVNTAGEGSVMGQKMQGSYYYVFLRMFTGTAALFPAISGYSLLQVILITVIVQGSLLADLVWYKIGTLASAGSGVYSSYYTNPTTPEDLYPFLQRSGGKAISNQNIGTHNSNIKKVFANSISAYNILYCNHILNSKSDGALEVDASNRYDAGSCGSITFGGSAYEANNFLNMLNGLAVTRYRSVINQQTLQQDAAAINSIRLNLATFSINYVSLIESAQLSANTQTGDSTCNGVGFYGGWMSAASEYKNLVCVEKKIIPTLSAVRFEVVPYDNDVKNRIKAYLLQPVSNPDLYVGQAIGVPKPLTGTKLQINIRNTLKLVTNRYFGNNDALKNVDYAPPPITTARPIAKQEIKDDVFAFSFEKGVEKFDHKAIAKNIEAGMTNAIMDSYVAMSNAAKAATIQIDSYGAAFRPLGSYEPINHIFRFLIMNSMYTWQQTFVDDVYDLARNPIEKISLFGSEIVKFSAVFFESLINHVYKIAIESAFVTFFNGLASWIGGTILNSVGFYMAKWGGTFTFSCMGSPPQFFAPPNFCITAPFMPIWNILIGAVVGLVGVALAIAGVALLVAGPGFFFTMFQIALANKLAYVSLSFAVAAPIMALGGSIAFYLPFVPILVYTLASISWIFSVIESMVAAPIVLLGVTFPKGHDLLGAAQQGFMLFFGVFIRPVLIVIGFIFSILVTSAAVTLASIVFGQMVLNMFASLPRDSLLSVIMVGAVMVVYAIGMLNVVDYSFSFVFRLPVTVMKWIGLPTTDTMEEQLMQDIKGGVSSSFREVGEGFGGMAGGLSGKAGGLQQQGATKQSVDKQTGGAGSAASRGAGGVGI